MDGRKTSLKRLLKRNNSTERQSVEYAVRPSEELHEAFEGRILVLIGSFIVFIFFIAACVKSEWSIKNEGGIWDPCPHTYATKCVHLQQSPTWLHGSRGLIVFACFMSLTAIITAFASVILRKIRGFITSVFLMLAGISMIIAVALYTTYNKKDTPHGMESLQNSHSYTMAWCGLIVAFGTSIGALVVEKCKRIIPEETDNYRLVEHNEYSQLWL